MQELSLQLVFSVSRDYIPSEAYSCPLRCCPEATLWANLLGRVGNPRKQIYQREVLGTGTV